MDDLEAYLKQLLKGNNPALQTMAGNAKRRIGQGVDSNVRQIKEQAASSGFRGVSANNINDAYKIGADATVQMEDSIMEKNMNMQQFAAGQLNQLEANKTDVWDVVGGVLGAGAGALGGGFLGKLGSNWV